MGVIAIDTALYVADYLVKSGVQRVYVVADPEIAAALNAFRLRGMAIVPTPDPTGGAMLAAAESAVHAGAGVIVSGSGPSAAAIAPAAAQAQIEHRALIAITVEPNGLQPRTSARRLLDLRAMFATVSKGSYRLTADNARELVPLAWRLATTPPRGVVHLRVLGGELNKTAPAARGQALPPAPPPNEEHAALVSRAAAKVSAAERPVLLIGPEAVEARADTAARLLAEQWHAPVIVTPMAKGLFPETHPAFAGIYGALGDSPVVQLIQQSDLVVGFGATSADFVRDWRSSVPAIHLTHSGSPDSGFPAEVTLVGPLNALANELPRHAAETAEEGEARAASVRAAVRGALESAARDQQFLTPQTVLSELRGLASFDVPLAVETDVAGLLAAQMWVTTEPGTFLISNGLGHPGSGLALAAVAALERSEGIVLWLGTDASLIARPGLLTHVRDVGCTLPLVVISQGLHTDLLRAQEAAGYPRVASEYTPPNFEALAGAYGLRYTRVRTTDDLDEALASALTARGPSLIDVVVDRDTWWRVG